MPRPTRSLSVVLAVLATVPAVAFATGLQGTPGDDRLRGTAQPDVISGVAGDDELRGYDGDDVLDGGRGNDRLTGGRGADVLKGGPGDDRLNGGPGADVVRCGGGRDQVTLDADDVIADATDHRPDGACESVRRPAPKS